MLHRAFISIFVLVTSFSVSADSQAPLKRITNAIGMEFVEIPAGEFTMGSAADNPAHDVDEIQHTVKITQSFFLQTTEVTQQQWLALLEGNPSAYQDCIQCPVDRLKHEWIEFYIGKLNEVEPDKRYRLPTEAEWEYAARAGTSGNFYTGECLSEGEANVTGNDQMPGCEPFATSTGPVPVASYPPNPWGLYDMYGNAWEMCSDWYGPYDANKTVDPKGPTTGKQKVLRGGSWRFPPVFSRSANRFRNIREISGFRLVLILE